MTDVSNASKAGAPPRLLSNSQVLAFIAAQWMRRPWQFAATVALVMAGVGADLFFPAAAEHLTKAVAGDPAHDLGAVWNAWGLFVAVYVAALAFRNSSFFFIIPFAARNMEDLVNDAFKRVQSFSADWHADTFAGATVRKVTRAMWAYDQVSDVVILMLGPSLLVLLGLSTMMVLRWPLVGLFSYGAVALYIGVSLLLAKTWLRPANLKSNALDSELGAAVADAISSNPTVKSFGAEDREEARFARTVAAWRRATITSWSRGTQTWVLQNLVLVLLQGGLTGVLVFYWSVGKASAGDITFAITAFLLMSGYLRNFGETVRQFQRGMDDAEAAAAYMRTPPQVPDRPDARAFRPGAGEIVFDHVGFGYRRQSEAIYDDFNLTIRPGERVALVGPTGSGKSTFVKLIQRLYDIQDGRILIDGQDIALVSQESLRRAIAVVPQDPALFHRSIGENIGYARPRGDARRDHRRGAAGPRPRLHRSTARRLRHPGGRARGQALRRRTPARGHRPRLPGRRPDPGAR